MKSVIFIMFLCNVADLRPFKDLKKCKYAYVLDLIEPPSPLVRKHTLFRDPLPPSFVRTYYVNDPQCNLWKHNIIDEVMQMKSEKLKSKNKSLRYPTR